MRNDEVFSGFLAELEAEERKPATIEKYARDVGRFLSDMGEGELTRETVAAWRDGLLDTLTATSVNSMVSAVNRYLGYIRRPGCRVKHLRVQRRVFRAPERDLTRDEYGRLLDAAPERLALIMETICSTGIRVSELRCITAEAVGAGRAEIRLKGKVRTILLPGKLCRQLRKYAKKQKIASGEIFLTRSGRPITRRQVWAEMKAVCKKAGVDPRKVFPHNLRHLFARVFYRATRDIAMLADVLGHSSVDTTRIYLISTGAEHARVLDGLGLVRFNKIR